MTGENLSFLPLKNATHLSRRATALDNGTENAVNSAKKEEDMASDIFRVDGIFLGFEVKTSQSQK